MDSSSPSSQESAGSAQPVFWTNPLTLGGLLLIAIGLLLQLTFWLFEIVTPGPLEVEYANIAGYLVIPSIWVAGLFLCPIGIILRRRRYRRTGVDKHISARAALIFLSISFFVTLPLLGVAGYKGYHYTESAEFCGSCHSVMAPHSVAYQESAHARTNCAGCHIGPGADFLVKSKVSGTRQLFAVMLETYSKPIPTAIKHLRPARETCEECHWPQRFYGSQLKPIVRYSPDEKNTRHVFKILLKVGGQSPQLGRAEGIHMHMVEGIKYIAADETLQKIPWVEYTRPDGSVVIYRSDGKSATDSPPQGMVRELDCIDCHNRSGHLFRSPTSSMDLALDARRLDASLPFIKREGVRLLAQTYESHEAAAETFEEELTSFYREAYPEIWQEREESVREAVDVLADLYSRTAFPSMEVNWRTYPDNIGHMDFPGCFRCHDGLHVNAKQEAITSECAACHTFLNPVPNSNMIRQGDFQHQLKIHENWEDLGPHQNLRCDQCHTGGEEAWGENPDESRCGDCHDSDRWLELRGKGGFRPTSHPSAE